MLITPLQGARDQHAQLVVAMPAPLPQRVIAEQRADLRAPTLHFIVNGYR
jgi:hypothetical protein